MERLTETELDHVANLARLSLTPAEREKYATDLALILNDIQKINEVKDVTKKGDRLLISPTENQNCYDEGVKIESISKADALRNSKLSDGDYIVVPTVIHD